MGYVESAGKMALEDRDKLGTKFSLSLEGPLVHILCPVNLTVCAQLDHNMWGIGYFREK